MHRPAVTLIFTLMGEWQVRGNEIGMREEQRKAAWSVSPCRCLPLFLGASQGSSQPRKATVFVVPGAQPAGTQVQAQRIFLPVSSAPLGSGAGRAWLVGIC